MGAVKKALPDAFSSKPTHTQHPLGDRPLTIKRKSCEVKIYPTWDRKYVTCSKTKEKSLKSQAPQFALVFYSGGKRHVKKFNDLDRAKSESKNILQMLIDGKSEATELSGRDREVYLQAAKALNNYDPSLDIDTAVQRFLRAEQKMQGLGFHIEDAVREFAQRQHLVVKPQRIIDIVEELIETKRKAERSELYIKDLNKLRKFGNTFEIFAHDLSLTMLQKYIDGLGAPRTQINHLRQIRTLYGFAIKRKYVQSEMLEIIEGVELPAEPNSTAEIFTPEELSEMLATCPSKLTPWLAIASFCGLRTAEIQRLDWSEVDINRKIVTVKAEKAKTGSRRVVPMPDAATQWLALHNKREGRVAYYSNGNKFTERIVESVNQARKAKANTNSFKWKKNALRHSFCSYRLAVLKNAAQVAYEAGNSATMIFKHYHELVMPEDAEKWFSIYPNPD